MLIPRRTPSDRKVSEEKRKTLLIVGGGRVWTVLVILRLDGQSQRDGNHGNHCTYYGVFGELDWLSRFGNYIFPVHSCGHFVLPAKPQVSFCTSLRPTIEHSRNVLRADKDNLKDYFCLFSS